MPQLNRCRMTAQTSWQGLYLNLKPVSVHHHSTLLVLLLKKTSLNDYRPVAITAIGVKGFEKLVRIHIIASLPPALDTHQFTYKANRSTENTIATALHCALIHLQQWASYTGLLFVDFS